MSKDKILNGEYARVLVYVEAKRATEAMVETDEDSTRGVAEGDFIVRHGSKDVVLSLDEFYQALPEYDVTNYNGDSPAPLPFCALKTKLGIEVHEASLLDDPVADQPVTDPDVPDTPSGD